LIVCGLVLSALPARADDAADLLAQARAAASRDRSGPASATCAEGVASAVPGKFCRSVADCQAYCSCACSFDPHKWKADVKDDGSTVCPGMEETGEGMLPPDSADLLPVSSLPYLSVPAGVKATREARDGLIRLSAALAASANRSRYGYTVRVASCYRRHLEDSVPECGIVLKGKYMLDRVTDPARRRDWLVASDPNHLGLSWPGRTPHSGGYACDLILRDENGRDCFDWRAGVDGPPSCSIEQRLASSLMDQEATSAEVGAKRLTFEAWHFEWGPKATGCRAPDCADRYWPPVGHP
jgi:hypothetical protein